MRLGLLACFAAACSSQNPVVVPPDAGTDAGADVIEEVDAAKTFCETESATFCADFDKGEHTAGWDGEDVAGGGALALDEAPPRSVVASIPAGTLGDTPRALLTKSLASATSIVVLMKAKIDPKCFEDSGAGYALALLQVGGWAASLVASKANAQLMPVTPPSHLMANGAKKIIDPLPTGEWITLRLALDLTAKTFHFVVIGTSDKREESLAVTPPAGAIKARIGIDAILGTASQGCEIRYGDVTVALR
jgi:hypothetical protein